MAVSDPTLLVPYFRYTTSSKLCTTAMQQLTTRDPNRVALIFSNIGNSAASVTSDSTLQASGSQGIGLLANGTPFVLTYAQVGGLVGEPWYGGAQLNTSTINVVEVRYLPPAQET